VNEVEARFGVVFGVRTDRKREGDGGCEKEETTGAGAHGWGEGSDRTMVRGSFLSRTLASIGLGHFTAKPSLKTARMVTECLIFDFRLLPTLGGAGQLFFGRVAEPG
jgi:hypothetical protein